MRRFVGLFLFGFSYLPISAFSAVAPLPHRDPLQEPPPVLKAPLQLPMSPERSEEKITPRLWRLVAEDGDREVSIIIELHSPILAIKSSPHSPVWDEARNDVAAAAEHQFVAKAGGLLRSPRGLPYFPFVLANCRPGDLLSIAALREVKRIYPDEIHAYSRSEGAALIRADQLRTALLGTGQGVGVAVVDSGVDATHPELSSAVVAQGNYSGEPGPGTVDPVGHGTACAGIIGGRAGGMAPAAGIWAIRAGSAEGVATSAALAALADLYVNRNQFGGLHVINLSFGGQAPIDSDCDASSPYDTFFDNLTAAGITIFVASGNDGFGNGVSSPACHSKVIAIGAVYDTNVGPATFSNCADTATAADQIACYSNSGIPLDALAPGHCARVPQAGGGYDNCFGGTSAATPYAAGVAAQILSLLPGTTPTALRTAFMTTGRPRTDVNSITRNRIDAVAAFEALGGGGNTAPCVRDSDTACLLSGRFEVEVDWQTSSSNGLGQIMSFGGQRTENDESVFWWFFSPTNFEIGIKLLNACVPVLGNKHWVFVSGLTNQGWTVHVRDTQTGATRSYANAINHLSETFTDTGAFNCP